MAGQYIAEKSVDEYYETNIGYISKWGKGWKREIERERERKWEKKNTMTEGQKESVRVYLDGWVGEKERNDKFETW